MAKLLKLRALMQGGGVSAPVYLFHDTFTTPQAAPLTTPRTCEPGPGTAVLVDSAGNKAAISSGQYGWASATGTHDPAYVGQVALTRAAGVCLLISVYMAASRTQSGLSSSATNSAAAIGGGRRGVWDLNGTSLGIPSSSGAKTAIGQVATIALNTQYMLLIMLRSDGARYFIKGGAYTSWRLLFNEQDGNVSPLYGFLGNIGTTTNILFDEIAGIQLFGEWASDTVLYSVNQANPPTGTNYPTTEAEGLFNMLCTTPASLAGSAELRYDVIDDSNYSVAYFNSSGAFRVDSVVGGVPTNKVNAAAVVSTSQVAGIKVSTFGTTHRFWTYDATNGWTVRTTVTSMPAPTSAVIKAVYSSYSVTRLEAEPATVTLPFELALPNRSFFTFGDSKTNGQGDTGTNGTNGFQPVLLTNLNAAGAYRWFEVTRVAHDGYTVDDAKAAVDTDIASINNVPDYILLNLGRNNTDYKANAAQWVSDYQYIIDALHTKWQRAQIYLMRVGARSEPSVWVTMGDTHLPAVIAGRAWAHLGPDERIFLEGNDDYATYTDDGSHPNHAGYALAAQEWQEVIGF